MADKTSEKTNDKSNKKKKPSFFKGLKKEFKKVTWPTKDAVTKETIAVVVITLVLGVVITLLDAVCQSGVFFLTNF